METSHKATTPSPSLLLYCKVIRRTGSGDGSGSGILVPDCPQAPIKVNITRPINTEFLSQVHLTGIRLPVASKPDDLSVSITQIKLRPEAVNFRIAAGDVTVQIKLSSDGEKLTVTIAGDLVSATMIIVDILVLDEDDMMMMMDDSSCKFSIEITVQDRSNCAEESSIVRISNAQLEGFFAVTLTLNIHVADFNSDSSILTQIATPIVRILNSVCPQDCNRCGMGGSCNSYLQFCQEFSVSDIELYNAPKAGLSRLVKRAIPTTTTQNTTVINLVLRHPTGSPLSGIVALVPPFTSLSALNDALQTIQNTTGITIFDTDALINSSNIIMTTFFAHIVLPIMIILFVLILAIGVIIILIVGRKRKNNRKKSKIRPLIGSTSS